MSYHSHNKKIIDTEKNITVAVATYKSGAEIIVNALNFYFGDAVEKNKAVEMMHLDTARALKLIANFIEKHEYPLEKTIEYLREVSDELEAQAQVVALRDELKFDAPNE